MKIYTGTGDRGKTGLFSGERVSKCHGRIEAYGDIDELGSVLGALGAALGSDQEDLRGEVQEIQAHLLCLSAWLATTPGSPAADALKPIPSGRAQTLERAIDRMQDALPELQGFVLPGGHATAAWAHLARTVCRRAERRLVAVVEVESAEKDAMMNEAMIYLNRLSDYLFVLARTCNRRQGVSDALWEP